MTIEEQLEEYKRKSSGSVNTRSISDKRQSPMHCLTKRTSRSLKPHGS